MEIDNPSGQRGAVSFDGWYSHADSRKLTIWFQETPIYGVLRLFTAENADSISVLAVDGARPLPGEAPPYHLAAMLGPPATFQVILQDALGKRAVIDAVTGKARAMRQPES